MTPEKLKQIRLSAGLTQSQLAKVFGISSDRYIRELEAGFSKGKPLTPSRPLQMLYEMLDAGELPERYLNR